MTAPTDELKPHQHIRAWRKRMKLTQEALSAKLEVSPPTVSGIENGKIGVSLTRLAQIAQALGITLAQILEAPPNPEKREADAAREEVLRIYDSLPADLRPVYLAQVRALQGVARSARRDQSDPD